VQVLSADNRDNPKCLASPQCAWSIVRRDGAWTT
jgi:hypothetical protein